jgi:hypothetical protein
MSSTAVAAPEETGTDLSPADQVAAEVRAAQQAEYAGDTSLLQTPILKLAQALTREVQEGEAEPGEFINTLTSETLGDKVQFIPVYYNRGRFASDPESGRAFTAFGATIPAHWEPLVKEEWVGQPFSEYPEAEEVFKAQVDAKEREWAKGPLVSTTHNFTGFVVVPDEETGEDTIQPVRLSLKRTDVPAARKINTLLNMTLGNKPFWDVVLTLQSATKETRGKTSYIVAPSAIKVLRKTTDEEKAQGAALAQAVIQGRTVSEGAEEALADAPAEPQSGGGLAID